MKEQFTSFEVSKVAKEKGFDTQSKWYYDKYGNEHYSKQLLTQKSLRSDGFIKCPQSLLQKWLREKHEISIDMETLNWDSDKLFEYIPIITKRYEVIELRKFKSKSYEQSLEAGLQEALKLI